VEQLGFEGMPRRLYSCTPTRLANWLDCPRRYRMTYLDRPRPPKGPPWAHNSVGASVHNALAGWWRLPLAARTVTAAGDLLERGWLTDGFVDPAQSAGQRAQARQLVETYVAGLDPAADPAGVERTVAARTDLIAFSGRIDRLDRRDQGLVVVDYKTGRRPLTVDDARSSMALALYALAAGRVLRQPCLRVELHHLPTRQVLAWEHTPQSLERQLHRAEDIAGECADADEAFRGGESGSGADRSGAERSGAERSGAEQSGAERPPAAQAGARQDEVFPPRPGIGCGWCDYQAHCPEGMAAAEPRRPWDGLADDVPGGTPVPPPRPASPLPAPSAGTAPSAGPPSAAGTAPSGGTAPSAGTV
jgi:putative RecB family exonuclease